MKRRTELRVSKIESGTVIDHIESGRAISILLELDLHKEYPNSVLSMIVNVPSKSKGVKDILKIEGIKISREDMQQIVRISPNVTINFIKDFEIVRKGKAREMLEDGL
ncbi:MAG: aspartate carbamoyltransferase regulatory subunit [Candidatus Aenigmarchaeota archaeon]|nr:aspartate carbamoyltransferase regulatory subunit [Candidatus Aenigmarchaeota archaeon]